MDPDPAIFVIDLQDASKKLIFKHNFLHLHYFSKIKIQKESQNSSIQGFSYYFCMMIEGSGSRAGSGSGSIPLTSGSGSGRPKNTWIRWIRILIRIRIRNTDQNYVLRRRTLTRKRRMSTVLKRATPRVCCTRPTAYAPTAPSGSASRCWGGPWTASIPATSATPYLRRGRSYGHILPPPIRPARSTGQPVR